MRQYVQAKCSISFPLFFMHEIWGFGVLSISGGIASRAHGCLSQINSIILPLTSLLGDGNQTGARDKSGIRLRHRSGCRLAGVGRRHPTVPETEPGDHIPSNSVRAQQ